MKLYRNAYRTEAEGSKGFEWFSSLAEARSAWRSMVECGNHEGPMVFTVHYVQPNKSSLRKFLNDFAGYPDNG